MKNIDNWPRLKFLNTDQTPFPGRGGWVIADTTFGNDKHIVELLRKLLADHGFIEGIDYIMRLHGQPTAMFVDEEKFILAKMCL